MNARPVLLPPIALPHFTVAVIFRPTVAGTPPQVWTNPQGDG
ncbi:MULTISPECIES: hypothetical protein [Streptomyces]|uniref:Uncharacterized protein n=1 Tax=Streptomyces cyaneofuscatus TaxID=66883 RepID=A0ABZ1F8C0_9ACTN|nr:hypothetical protein [Streptomyces cyaneofuscatus]WSB12587.1 hypothetical protein OG849_02365 [Streptomyces cyaneofuscatus]WSD51138.1 hypothetical protein OG857_33035 [Streptomyces cyaneofuscatus]WTA94647.1 hypothetical protein OG323_34695 [Streptomyces cyaneofuscatus]